MWGVSLKGRKGGTVALRLILSRRFLRLTLRLCRGQAPGQQQREARVPHVSRVFSALGSVLFETRGGPRASGSGPILSAFVGAGPGGRRRGLVGGKGREAGSGPPRPVLVFSEVEGSPAPGWVG